MSVGRSVCTHDLSVTVVAKNVILIMGHCLCRMMQTSWNVIFPYIVLGFLLYSPHCLQKCSCDSCVSEPKPSWIYLLQLPEKASLFPPPLYSWCWLYIIPQYHTMSVLKKTVYYHTQKLNTSRVNLCLDTDRRQHLDHNWQSGAHEILFVRNPKLLNNNGPWECMHIFGVNRDKSPYDNISKWFFLLLHI